MVGGRDGRRTGPAPGGAAPLTHTEPVDVVRLSKRLSYVLRHRASVDVELGYRLQAPPAELFHGTVEASVPAILCEGLLPGRRHAVHLSPTWS